MKRIFSFIILPISICLIAFSSCNLNEEPISSISELGGKDEETGEEYAFKDRAQMKAQYDGMYKGINGAQEFWYLDVLVNTETHADNSYSGTTGAELISLEKQSQDGTNKNLNRDWTNYLSQVAIANRIICNIDEVPDPSFTAAERKQWKSEALIWRAWMYFDMVRLWGDVPLIIEEAPAINNSNFEEVYPMLFPTRTPMLEVYAQIVKDLEEALEGAPAVNPSNKQYLSKGVANALLAKVYAEKPIRDYNKTIQYCAAVEAAGFDLMPNYSDLYSVNDAKTDVNYRNTKESIFEMVYNVGNGNWCTWMFGIDVTDPNSKYDWAKWITPSRDLIQAYQNEGDDVRMNQAIVWGQPSWSNHYPSNHYPFMYKTRSKYNSVIKLRFADILLLKAEAYVATGNLPAAASIVDRIRDRVELAPLSASVKTSAEKMKEAVLKERRLELAFEGQRWFDLVRNDVVLEVMNTLNTRDSGRTPMLKITEQTILFPVPEGQIELNSNLTQNPGY